MILVTGTDHSGASLWMQILGAAGFPSLGEGTAGALLRDGVYYATNPNPTTGEYLLPEQVEHHAVSVTVSGLVRTDRAYMGRVIASVRDHREYIALASQLHAIEDLGTPGAPRVRLPSWLTWWAENYAIVRDVAMRRYPAHVESHARLVRDSEQVIRDVLGWMGRGDAEAAVSRVKPENRETSHVGKPGAPDVPEVPPDVARVFDALHAAIDTRSGLTPALIAELNETHRTLLPLILDGERLVKAARAP